MKAIGYVRVSTEQQSNEDRFGIDAQKKAIKEYADKNDYEIVDWKVDVCSGVSDNRPEFNSIIDERFVTNPPIQAVISYKSDRVAKETKLYFYYLYVLEKRNIKLLSVIEEFTEGKEFANNSKALMQFVAEQERKNIARRTSAGRKVKQLAGGYIGGSPAYGYDAGKGGLVINEEEAKFVRKIFEFHNLGWNYTKIATYLNDNGVRNRKGNYLQSTNVMRIVANEKLYRGYVRIGKTDEWVKGVHKPILTD